MPHYISQFKDIKKKMVSRRSGKEILLVPIVKDVAEMKEMYTLNEVAAFIWDNIEDASSVDDLVSAVAGEFETDTNTALKDIVELLNQLKEG